jgi:hypothetical protein
MDYYTNIILAVVLLVIIVVKFSMDNRKPRFNDMYSHLSPQERHEIIKKNDRDLEKLYENAKFKHLRENNKKSIEEINQKPKDYKIAIVTFEDRNDEYIDLHNKNIKLYCDKWNCEYIHATKNTNGTSAYWFKVFLVQELLLTDKYDYVFWMDSDAVINNFNIDLGKDILHLYDSDIFIAPDNARYDVSNSGLFIIRNSEMGKKFLEDWTNSYLPMCEQENGKLAGKWAMSCYEQGIMNKLIEEKYWKYTTLLDKEVFHNKNQCNSNVFITHYYASNKYQRAQCFRKAKH